MRIEWWILIAVWVLTTGLLFLIPKNKRRLAAASFLFIQLLTWILGLAVVELGLITYPVRFFADVNRTSYTFEFFVYPAVSGVFNAFYPIKRSKTVKFLYYSAYCTAMTVPEVIFEKYTELIKYHHWTWYITWTSLFLTFAATRWFCVWFFRGLRV